MRQNENMRLLEEIVSRQTKGHEDTTVECVGQQLLDIARNEPACAELLVKDLEVSGMGIVDAEKEIKKAADEKHKKGKGNSVWISPIEAEGILRKFYGLPDATTEPFPVRDPVQAAMEDDMDILGMLLGG